MKASEEREYIEADRLPVNFFFFVGDIKVKVAPRAVSDREDRELTAVLEELERKNREVSGDSDEERYVLICIVFVR